MAYSQEDIQSKQNSTYGDGRREVSVPNIFNGFIINATRYPPVKHVNALPKTLEHTVMVSEDARLSYRISPLCFPQLTFASCCCALNKTQPFCASSCACKSIVPTSHLYTWPGRTSSSPWCRGRTSGCRWLARRCTQSGGKTDNAQS